MKKRITGWLVVGGSALAVAIIIGLMVWLLMEITWGGKDYLTWTFFTSEPREGMTEGGILPAIVGTVLLVLVMSVAGVPLGTVTAIYLSEYATHTSIFTRLIRFAVNTLAGVPSIVFGLFGLGFFVQFMGNGVDKVFYSGNLEWGQPNILWASITMAFLTIPVVIVSVEEALKAVPGDLRAASTALGATRWQTVSRVVLPQAVSGILTGAILAVGRGAGEVAPILFTGAAYYLPHLPDSLSDQFMNLGYHVYIMSTQSADVEATKGIQYATVLVLLLLVFSMNLSAVVIRYRFRRRLRN
ncbi:MAG: phosphate ABC transporter permease PstA [Acidobacteria bacterium]|nr:MAG: phosphate ABC transporter permease PstA [Acidobacteriota bacterium]